MSKHPILGFSLEADFLGAAVFECHLSEFERCFTAAAKSQKNSRAFKELIIYLIVDSKINTGTPRTIKHGANKARRVSGDVMLTARIRNKDWFGQSRPHNRKLFYNLMCECLDEFGSWMLRQKCEEDEEALSIIAPLALKYFAARKYAPKRYTKAQDPFGKGGDYHYLVAGNSDADG